MKFLVVLSAVVACTLAKPGIGYSALGGLVAAPELLAAPGVIAPGLAARSLAYSTPLSYAAPWSYAGLPAIAAAPAVAPFLAARAAIAAPVAVASPAIKSQYHAQDELGNTAFGHSEPGQVHSSVQDAHGNRVGSFSYLNPTDGQVHRTDYVADSLGYRVAANDLPLGPAAPIADTPEVVAARAAHLAAHGRARRSLLTTPAATATLATPLVYAAHTAYSAPIHAPLAAPLAASIHAPLSYSAHLGLPATLTTIVNNPGHAVSYRID